MAASSEVKPPLSSEVSLSTLANAQSAPGLYDPIASAPKAAMIANPTTAFIWRNAVTDQTGGWTIQGTTFQSSILFENTPSVGSNSNWKIIDAGSFLDGGENTLIWRNAVTDETAVWFLDETGFETGFVLTATPSLGSNSPWRLVGGVSLNEAPGLVWRNQASDETAVWLFNEEGKFLDSALLDTPKVGANSPWQLVDAIADDDEMQLLWRNQATDETAIWNFDGTEFESGEVVTAPAIGGNSPWEIAKFVDVNSDDSADLIWQNRTTGEQAIWFLDGATFKSSAVIEDAPRPDVNWQIVGVVAVELPDPVFIEQGGLAALTESNLPATENLIWSNNAIDQIAAWGINTDEFSAVFVNGALVEGVPAIGNNSPWKLVDTISRPDGDVQFLWRNQATDETAIWEIEDNEFISSSLLDVPKVGQNSPWQLVGGAVLGESEQTTLVWRNPATDETAVWMIDDDYEFVSGQIIEDAPALGSNSQWTLIDIADRSGNLGLLWRNPVTDETGFWNVMDGEFSSGALLEDAPQVGSNSPWQIVRTDDVNNDGSPDLIWQNFASGQQAIWYLENDVFQAGRLLEGAPTPDANWKIVGSTTMMFR
jgi:hypothetical protein